MIPDITQSKSSDPYSFKATSKEYQNQRCVYLASFSVPALKGHTFKRKFISGIPNQIRVMCLLCVKMYQIASKSPATALFFAHFCFRNIVLCPPAKGGNRGSHNGDKSSLFGPPSPFSPLSKILSEPTGGQALFLRCFERISASFPLLEQCHQISLSAFLGELSRCAASEGCAGGCIFGENTRKWSCPQP